MKENIKQRKIFGRSGTIGLVAAGTLALVASGFATMGFATGASVAKPMSILMHLKFPRIIQPQRI
ncbi:MAG: hypothetical protein C7B45_17410 [Sulfobacillus acidophilus]|uniref:Uncharacterized protein n=1 Tax=Sulfobacillus acidophilus TaxID=53633 RepID=A0A2T2WCI3_9FIRM|nr:MAG: hypothetical protein C7B45_17410 [Sulfobacillus acidophilus]